MKKQIMIIGVAGVVLLGGALGVGAFSETTQGKDSELISMKQAEEIAVNEVGGAVESIELEKDDGRLKYEIDLRDQNGNDDIDVDIDAKTGEIIKVDRDDDDDDKVRLETGSAQTHNTAVKSNTQNANTQATKQRITKEEAIAIALKESPGKVIEVEYDDGEYEIEIRTDTHEVEYEIDARTGKILEKDMDDLDD